MVYNKIDSKNKVFGSDYNRISIITKNQIKKFKKMTKVNCAKQIIKQIIILYRLMNDYSEEEYKIFSRLFILNEFSEENLKKLSNIKIGIVGMGGIGCPLSQYLVNSGIKELLIVDGDIIEKSNLNRQILFNLNDIGKKKVDVAKYKLKLILSLIHISEPTRPR